MSYLLLNTGFLLLAAGVQAIAHRRTRPAGRDRIAIGSALLAVLALTAVFDNIMIGVGLVDYDPGRIAGVRVGLAPVEDFAYPVAVALLLPALWVLLGGADRTNTGGATVDAGDSR